MARQTQNCSNCPVAGRCIWRADEKPPAITATVRLYHRGESIFGAGDPCSDIYVVRSGLVKVHGITDHGVDHVLGFHYPGSVFGVEGFHLGEHITYAQSVDTTSICVLPRHQLLSAVKDQPALMMSLLGIAGGSIAKCVHSQLSLGTMSAERKIATFLLNTSEEFARQELSRTDLRLPMQRTEIAGYLSLAIETVSRGFRKLEDAGVIAVVPDDRHQVTILSLEGLRECANPTEALPVAA
ncbi:MAG: helix-turn-helix domain-containing protein [Pseudomonadota bacterium]